MDFLTFRVWPGLPDGPTRTAVLACDAQLQRLWTAAAFRPGYDKRAWMALAQTLSEVAEAAAAREAAR